MTVDSHLIWRKSSYSNNGGESCVEITFSRDGVVLIRDSKFLRNPANDPAVQPIITIPADAWPTFLELVGQSGHAAPGLPVSVEYDPAGGARLTDGHDITLTYTADEWKAYLAGVQAGEFAV